MARGKFITSNTKLGQRYGRPDTERIGIFAEMGYLHGAKYTSPATVKFNEDASKGRQMYPGGSKTPCALQDGYFDDKFARIFEKEALNNTIALARKQRLEARAKYRGGEFVPPGATKWHSTPGDLHGTFTKEMPAFSPVKKPKGKYVPLKPNVLTNPGKKGGPGYTDITLGKYPEHMADYFDAAPQYFKIYKEHMKRNLDGPMLSSLYPQPYFDPNPYHVQNPEPTYRVPPPRGVGTKFGPFYPSSPGKKDGGCKAGTFDKYPPHLSDRQTKGRPTRSSFSEGIFYPPASNRQFTLHSTVNYNIDMCVNNDNWFGFRPIVYPISFN